MVFLAKGLFGQDLQDHLDFSLFSQFPDETEKKRIRRRRKKTHSQEDLESGGFCGGLRWRCAQPRGIYPVL